MEELITTGAVTVGYETSWGERVRLAVCADRYERGGALALLALDATDPGDEDEYLERATRTSTWSSGAPSP